MNLELLFKKLSLISLESFNINTENIIVSDKILNNIRLHMGKLVIKDVALLDYLDIVVPSVDLNKLDGDTLKKLPVNVSAMEFNLSVDFLNRIISDKEILNLPDFVEEVHLEVLNNKLHVTGKAKKVITVPFKCDVALHVLPNGKEIKLTIENIQVFKFLPVSWLFNLLADSLLKVKFIKHVDKYFLIDTVKMLPVPVDIKFRGIEMDSKSRLITVLV